MFMFFVLFFSHFSMFCLWVLVYCGCVFAIVLIFFTSLEMRKLVIFCRYLFMSGFWLRSTGVCVCALYYYFACIQSLASVGYINDIINISWFYYAGNNNLVKHLIRVLLFIWCKTYICVYENAIIFKTI